MVQVHIQENKETGDYMLLLINHEQKQGSVAVDLILNNLGLMEDSMFC